ncbi:UvrD-helicase domain-containing protein [Nocardiopsis sp. HUAS JQ3]|uniref:UvrD-helicase domain-containing protein n=1 Tax=Nocardiopsis sp. HUAS JQ3 TaxID=3061629 RepID=UPI0023A9CEDF|nr:UvrD-helicase domain-containing protein [Nocardiopsis sp. HUAS JQ3]WDZ88900.1 UvrD-helicase domain-containing protein [Nocardiopsis sp. HUAS JQ3]
MSTDTLAAVDLGVLCADAARAQAEAATRLLDPGEVLWVKACPGAGKTRVIVDRHLAQPPPGRRGRAIASFTRAASREVRSRIISE